MLIVSCKHRTLPHALIARQFNSSARASHLSLPSWKQKQTQHPNRGSNQPTRSAPKWPHIPSQLSKASEDLKDPDGNEGNTSSSQPQLFPTKKRRFRIERPPSLWRSRYTKRLDEPIVGLGLDLDFDPFKPPAGEEKPDTRSNDIEDLAQEQLSSTIFETPFLTMDDPTSNRQLHTSKGKLDRPVLMPTSNVVHVSNLPKHFTPTHVRKLMTRFGNVQNVIMERYEREHEMASCSSDKKDDDSTPDIGSGSNPLPTQTTTLYGGWAKVTFRHRLKPGHLRPVDGNVVGNRAAQRAIEACKNDLLVKNESERKLFVHGQQLSVQPWTENPEQQEKELDIAMDRLVCQTSLSQTHQYSFAFLHTASSIWMGRY